LPLSYRKRGDVWHVRGTVRVGRQTVPIGEHSTGCRTRSDAEAVGSAEEARVRAEVIEGPGGKLRVITIAECIIAYGSRAKGIQPYDADRCTDFNDRIGDWTVAEAEEAWQHWLKTRGSKMKPATQARSRATLQAVLNEGGKALTFAAPKLSSIAQTTEEAVVYLTKEEQDRLLGSYNKWVAPIALMLCYQGMRTQEVLQLDWRNIDWTRRTAFIAKSKTGKQRTVPLHPRVYQTLRADWAERKQPETGPVFLSNRKTGYADTRGKGGNPIATAHGTACKAAKISAFRVHDWRHHWASWMVMSGCDLTTLMRLGGWSSPRMVQRYVALSVDHMAEAIARMA
jgi:integrase